MNLTNETIESTYGNLLTIGDAAGTPTQGTLQNGNGQAVTNLTLDELQVNKLVQTQATIAASGTSLASATLLTAGINLVTSADTNNIAVKLPQPELGLVINVVNTSSRAIEVYPYSATDSILGLNDGEAYIVPADGQLYRIVCVQNPSIGVWSVSTPTSSNSVTRTVSVNLAADGTYVGFNGEAWSAANLMNLTLTTYYINNNPVYVLNAPANTVDYFDAPEFNTYNKVKLSKLSLKSNVPAGDLTTSPSQFASTLMGITGSQLYNCFGYIRTSTRDASTVYNMNDFQTVRFLDSYSALVATGSSTQGFGHYMGSDGNLYQKYDVSLPANPSWDINDSNGVRNIYFSPYIGYGSATTNTPYTGYPAGFSFEVEVVVEFEFSM